MYYQLSQTHVLSNVFVNVPWRVQIVGFDLNSTICQIYGFFNITTVTFLHILQKTQLPAVSMTLSPPILLC